MKQGQGVSKERMERLKRAVEDNPDSAVAHMKLGTGFYWNGALKRAEQELLRAIELDEKYAEAWVHLGGVRLACWDFQGCVEANQRAVAINPSLMQAHYNQGLGFLYLNRPAEMVECFRRVVELDPEHAGGHYHLAVGLLAKGEKLEAQAELGRAVNLGYAPQPEFVKALDRAANGGVTA